MDSVRSTCLIGFNKGWAQGAEPCASSSLSCVRIANEYSLFSHWSSCRSIRKRVVRKDRWSYWTPRRRRDEMHCGSCHDAEEETHARCSTARPEPTWGKWGRWPDRREREGKTHQPPLDLCEYKTRLRQTKPYWHRPLKKMAMELVLHSLVSFNLLIHGMIIAVD